MKDYKFTFLDAKGSTEAQFVLHFSTDKDAIETGRDLHSHSRFDGMEVRDGQSVILRLDRSPATVAARRA